VPSKFIRREAHAPQPLVARILFELCLVARDIHLGFGKLQSFRIKVRHANASLLIAQGVDVRTVASLLGHAQASTTLDIYAHAFDKNKREAQKKLGKAIGL